MTFPESLADREAYILDAVDAGTASYDWSIVKVPASGSVPPIEFGVMADALKIDGLRVTAGAALAQKVADKIGASLPTLRMVDLTWFACAGFGTDSAGVTVAPCPRPISRATADVIAHSAAVDKLIAGRDGIVNNAGKWWVLTNQLLAHPGKACNYGWIVPPDEIQNGQWRGIPLEAAATILGARVIQGPGTQHNGSEDDYSQTVRLVDGQVRVDGVLQPLATVLADPVLSAALSHEGPLRVLRQPGVSP